MLTTEGMVVEEVIYIWGVAEVASREIVVVNAGKPVETADVLGLGR